MVEFDAGVICGELPIDLTLVGVGGGLLGIELGVEDVKVADAPLKFGGSSPRVRPRRS